MVRRIAACLGITLLLGVRPSVASAPTFPPGVNDWNCRPPAAHPYPVVLVHGTFFSTAISWETLAPMLVAKGYCVFALDYGSNGTAPVENSARELATFVDRVLRATGSSRVDIVGHSQGGMMPRYYMRFLGGAAKVDKLIGLSPSNHGTTTPLAPVVAPVCPSCGEQTAGSAFLTTLNTGGETVAGVSYTVIETRYDEVVTPYTSAFLQGPGVTNVLLQTDCPLDLSDHIAITYDSVALQWVEHALAGGSLPFRPRCF
jgi:triacylglycerol lipase